jgi:hypothetical protein
VLSESCEPLPQFPWGSPPLEKNSFVTSRRFILRSELFTRGQDISIRFPLSNLVRPLIVVAAASWHSLVIVPCSSAARVPPRGAKRIARGPSLLRPHIARFKRRLSVCSVCSLSADNRTLCVRTPTAQLKWSSGQCVKGGAIGRLAPESRSLVGSPNFWMFRGSARGMRLRTAVFHSLSLRHPRNFLPVRAYQPSP